MKIASLPNPDRRTRSWTTSLEPWQIEALEALRVRLGIDVDAMVRVGVTVALAVIASSHEAVVTTHEP